MAFTMARTMAFSAVKSGDDFYSWLNSIREGCLNGNADEEFWIKVVIRGVPHTFLGGRYYALLVDSIQLVGRGFTEHQGVLTATIPAMLATCT